VHGIITKENQFFEAVNKFRPDLILLNYYLFDPDDGELCNRFKANTGYGIFASLFIIVNRALHSSGEGGFKITNFI